MKWPKLQCLRVMQADEKHSIRKGESNVGL